MTRNSLRRDAVYGSHAHVGVPGFSCGSEDEVTRAVFAAKANLVEATLESVRLTEAPRLPEVSTVERPTPICWHSSVGLAERVFRWWSLQTYFGSGLLAYSRLPVSECLRHTIFPWYVQPFLESTWGNLAVIASLEKLEFTPSVFVDVLDAVTGSELCDARIVRLETGEVVPTWCLVWHQSRRMLAPWMSSDPREPTQIVRAARTAERATPADARTAIARAIASDALELPWLPPGERSGAIIDALSEMNDDHVIRNRMLGPRSRVDVLRAIRPQLRRRFRME